MYSRRLDQRVVQFGHEGRLYRNSFLLYDKPTRSLWVQVTGTCIGGSLKGRRLSLFPSTVTTWGDWKRRYPNTLVLAERQKPSLLGTFSGTDPKQAARFCLCLVHGDRAKAYPFAVLQSHPVINDSFEGEAVLVVFSTRLGAGNLWSRQASGRTLSFSFVADDPQRGPVLRDAQTGSHWLGLEGRAISGPLTDARLRLLPHFPVLKRAFADFYPGSAVYQPSGQEQM